MTISINEQIYRRGYKTVYGLYVPDFKLIQTIDKLKELDTNKKMNPIHRTTIEDATHDGRAFFTSFYDLKNVPYIKHRLFKKYQISEINPLDLPIYPVKKRDEICFGALLTEFLPNKEHPIVFQGILLNSIVTELTSCSYTHEITHASLDALKGAIKEYYNAEVLSIFNELVIAELLAKEERLLRALDSRRIHELDILCKELYLFSKGSISKSKDDALEDAKYIISDIRAYNLFAEYYYGSNSTKEYIISYINRIINGNSSLEELLNEFMDNKSISTNSESKLTLTPKAHKYFTR